MKGVVTGPSILPWVDKPDTAVGKVVGVPGGKVGAARPGDCGDLSISISDGVARAAAGGGDIAVFASGLAVVR